MVPLEISEEELQELYRWIDSVPLSKPKRSIARDFSDGLMMAEVVKHFFPKMVDVHNYIATNSVSKKVHNWKLLNVKVFSKIGLALSDQEIEAVANSVRGAIERILVLFREKAFSKKIKSTNSNSGSDEEQSISQDVPQAQPQVQSQVQPPKRAVKPTPTGNINNNNNNNNNHQYQPDDVPVAANNSRHRPNDERSRRGLVDEINAVDRELLLEKDAAIKDLRETVEILQLKIQKLEQLISLKDSKIERLQQKLEQAHLE